MMDAGDINRLATDLTTTLIETVEAKLGRNLSEVEYEKLEELAFADVETAVEAVVKAVKA